MAYLCMRLAADKRDRKRCARGLPRPSVITHQASHLVGFPRRIACSAMAMPMAVVEKVSHDHCSKAFCFSMEKSSGGNPSKKSGESSAKDPGTKRDATPIYQDTLSELRQVLSRGSHVFTTISYATFLRLLSGWHTAVWDLWRTSDRSEGDLFRRGGCRSLRTQSGCHEHTGSSRVPIQPCAVESSS